ncbi:MAG TPA: peptide chain release factor N(5)-glutamine methyltransferase [Ignavibacteria bacterium]
MGNEKINKIIDLIKWGESFFKEKNIPEPRLNIELMLCNILNCKRINLYLDYDKPLNKEELTILRNFVKRRVQREPLQYILGETEFMGLKLRVNQSVLIPRPETELLVEEIINISKKNNGEEITILDIGTGSGNIAISLAKFINHSKIYSIDINKDTLKLAKENAEDNNVLDKIIFQELDILKADELPFNIKFDYVVSNPPYISIDDYKLLEPELKYEPILALTDFNDGFTFYRKILDISKKIMKKDGTIALEISYNQAETIKNLLLENNYYDIRVIKDYSNIERIIIGKLQ